MNSKVCRIFARQILFLFLVAAMLFSTVSNSQELDTELAQYILNTLGYEAGSEDGRLGPSTESALMLFQKNHSIPITGLLDKQTEEFLLYRLKNLKNEATNSESNLAKERINTAIERKETTLEPINSEADTELDPIDWVIIVGSLLYLFFILWVSYKILNWIKDRIFALISKLPWRTKARNQSKYDLKADQIPQIDRSANMTINKKSQRRPIYEFNRNPPPVSTTYDSSSSTDSYSKPSHKIEDNRSVTRKGFHAVKGIVSNNSRSSWVPSGKAVKVKGYSIDGLVYVGAAPCDGRMKGPDNSFIDPALSVGKVNNDWEGQDLSYWPNYSQLSTTARATYLNWLSEGRTRVINPGYMFLYFYGLERRYFRDTPSADDREKIIIEVVRLRNLFRDNRSASNYLGIFLDAASLAEDFDSPPQVRVGGGLSLSLKVGVARRAVREENIRSDWLLAWYLASPEAKLRTPARRCRAEFEAMFKALFDKDYPNGMKVNAPKRKLKATYEAASGQFSTDLSPYIGELPDIDSIRKPLSYAVKIADSATDELNGLSRLLGKNGDARATLLGHTLLPIDIRHLFPCEEVSVLRDWAHNVVAKGGLINSLDLIEQLTLERPDKLTRKYLTNASDTLLTLGVGLAPDPRFALRPPKENEPVVLFRLPEETKALDVSDRFRLASLKLGAATMMAQSDSKFLDSELTVINSIVENADGLDASEKVRLTATARWMQAVPPDMTTLRKKIKLAPKNTREVIANLAIEVVVADGDASNEEIKQLETLYKALELDPSRIHSALHASLSSNTDEPVTMRAATSVIKGPPIPVEKIIKKSSIGLDLAKIANIDKNTRTVSVLLNDIFSDQIEETAEEDNATIQNTNNLPGLSPKLTALAKELAAQDHWSETDFEALVTRHGAMPAGAIEAINEWSFNSYDKAYLDEYNGYDIDPDIAAEIGD